MAKPKIKGRTGDGKFAPGVSGNPSGRPTKLVADEATLEIVHGLGLIQATIRECAAVFHVDPTTFERFLNDQPGAREAYQDGQGEGMISLRRTQFALATNSAPMAIFLGKNFLGQTDKVVNEHIGDERVAMEADEMVRRAAEEMRALRRGDGTFVVVPDPKVVG